MLIIPKIDLKGVLTSVQGEKDREQSKIDHVKDSIRLLCDTEDQYKETLKEIKEKNEDALYPNWLKTAKAWVNEKSGGYYEK